MKAKVKVLDPKEVNGWCAVSSPNMREKYTFIVLGDFG